jgi:hypothetical protein
MATKTITYQVDDLTGEQETEGNPVETAEFALDGQGYEIDLSAANRNKLHDALAGFVAAARKVTGKARSATGTRAAKGTAAPRADRVQNQAMRDWARQHGAAVSERGRIPAEIDQAYHLGGDAAVAAIQEYVAKQQARIASQMPAQASNGQAVPVPEPANV